MLGDEAKNWNCSSFSLPFLCSSLLKKTYTHTEKQSTAVASAPLQYIADNPRVRELIFKEMRRREALEFLLQAAIMWREASPPRHFHSEALSPQCTCVSNKATGRASKNI